MSYIELKKISHKWYVYVRTSVRLGVRVVHKNKYIGALSYVYNALKQHVLRKKLIDLLLYEVKKKRKNKSSRVIAKKILHEPIINVLCSQDTSIKLKVSIMRVYYGFT